MKIKKIFSVLMFCMMVCGSVGAIGFQRNTAYATPSVMVVPFAAWNVWGETDLRHEIPLARTRECPQGIDKVISIINRCIREGRTLRVTRSLHMWYYEVR